MMISIDQSSIRDDSTAYYSIGFSKLRQRNLEPIIDRGRLRALNFQLPLNFLVAAGAIRQAHNHQPRDSFCLLSWGARTISPWGYVSVAFGNQLRVPGDSFAHQHLVFHQQSDFGG